MGFVPQDDDTDSIVKSVMDGSYFGKTESPKNDVSHLLDRIRTGAGQQESGNNYNVTPNARTGALGKFQVLPQNVPQWTARHYGKALTPAQFKTNPQAQDAVFNGEMGDYLKTAKAKGVDDDTAIRMGAAAWYGGKGAMHKYDNATRFRPNEPSFREYTNNVLKGAKTIPTNDIIKSVMDGSYFGNSSDDIVKSVADGSYFDTPQTKPSPTNPTQAPAPATTSAVPPTVPESYQTLESQLISTQDANAPRSMTLLTKGNPANDKILKASVAQGLTPIEIPNGTLLVNHQKLGISPEQVSDYVAKNGFAQGIGKVEDVGNNTGAGQTTVQSLAPNGTPVSESVVTTPENAQKQVALDKANTPGATSKLTTTDKVMSQRQTGTSAGEVSDLNYDEQGNVIGMSPVDQGGRQLQQVDVKNADEVNRSIRDVIDLPDNIKTKEQADKYVQSQLQAKYPQGNFDTSYFDYTPNMKKVNVTRGFLQQAGVESDVDEKVAQNRVENPTPDLSIKRNLTEDDANAIKTWLATNASGIFGEATPAISSAIGTAMNAGGNGARAIAGLMRIIGGLNPARMDSMAEAAGQKPYRAGEDIVKYLQDVASTTGSFAEASKTKTQNVATADDKGYIEGQPINRETGWSKIGGAVGGLADIPRIALFPGGPIVAFAADSALQAAGEGDTLDWDKVKEAGKKGGILGAATLVSGGIGKLATKAGAGNILAKGIELGSVSPIIYTTSRALGDSKEQAFDNAVLFTVFHGQKVFSERAQGKPIRVTDERGNEAVIKVENGKVTTLDPKTEAEVQVHIPEETYKEASNFADYAAKAAAIQGEAKAETTNVKPPTEPLGDEFASKADKPITIKGFRTEGADTFYKPTGKPQHGEGTYIALDEPYQPEKGKVTEHSVDLPPSKIVDPYGLIEGTNKRQSILDWNEAMAKLEAATPEDIRKAGGDAEFRKKILQEKGYEALAGHIEPALGELRPEPTGKELVVWNKDLVKDASQQASKSETQAEQPLTGETQTQPWQQTFDQYVAPIRDEGGYLSPELRQQALTDYDSAFKQQLEADKSQIPAHVLKEYAPHLADVYQLTKSEFAKDGGRFQEYGDLQRDINAKQLELNIAQKKLRNAKKLGTRMSADDAFKRLAAEMQGLKQKQDRFHKDAVKQALAEGKDVPPEVLADYPDLAQDTSAPSTQAKDVSIKGENIDTIVNAKPTEPLTTTAEAIYEHINNPQGDSTGKGNAEVKGNAAPNKSSEVVPPVAETNGTKTAKPDAATTQNVEQGSERSNKPADAEDGIPPGKTVISVRIPTETDIQKAVTDALAKAPDDKSAAVRFMRQSLLGMSGMGDDLARSVSKSQDAAIRPDSYKGVRNVARDSQRFLQGLVDKGFKTFTEVFDHYTDKSADVGSGEQAPKIPIKPKGDLAKFADNKIATADAIAAARARRAERLKNPTIKSSVLPVDVEELADLAIIATGHIEAAARKGGATFAKFVKDSADDFKDLSEDALRELYNKVRGEHGDKIPDIAEPPKQRSLPQTLEAGQLEKGTNLTYEPESINGRERGRAMIAEKGIDGAKEFVKNGTGIDWAPTAFAVMEHQANEIRATTDPELKAKLYQEHVEFVNDFAEKATTLGQTIAGIRAIEEFTPDKAVYLANRIAKKGLGRDLTPLEAEGIRRRAEKQQRINSDLEGIDRQLEEKEKQEKKPKEKKVTYLDKLEQNAENLKNALLKKKGSLDFGNLKVDQAFEGQRGAIGEKRALPGDAEDIAQVAAGRLHKVDTVDALNKELASAFGPEVEPYLPAIRKRAYEIRQEARMEALKDRDTTGSERRTIIQDIKAEIKEANDVEKNAVKARQLELNKAKADQIAEAKTQLEEAKKLEKAKQDAIIRDAKAKQDFLQEMAKQKDQKEQNALRDQYRVEREKQREADKAEQQKLRQEQSDRIAEAKQQAKDARDAQRQRDIALAKEAKERIKQAAKDLREAKIADRKAYKADIAAKRAAERSANFWDTPVRNMASEARTRLEGADINDAQTMTDLASVGAEKFLREEPGGAPGKRAISTGKFYREMMAEFPDLVTNKNRSEVFKQSYQRILDATTAAREAAALRSASKESRRLWNEEGIDAEHQALLIQKADKLRQSMENRNDQAAEFARVSQAPWKRIALGIKDSPRSMMASLNMHMGRQGLLSLLTHPIKVSAREAIPMTIKGFRASEAEFLKLSHELNNAPGADLAIRSGLNMAELPRTTLDAKGHVEEEQLRSGLAMKLPWVRKSTQGFILGMNAERLALFNMWADIGESHGYTEASNPEFFKGIAKLANDYTGRGAAPEAVEKFMKSPMVNELFFAPRLKVSQVMAINDLFNPFNYIGKNRLDPVQRSIRSREALRATVAMTALYTTLIALGGKGSDDPDDPDFFKVRFGHTHYDLTGGAGATFAFGYKFFKSIANYARGVPQKDYENPLGVAESFFRKKLAPIPSAILDTFTAKNAVGQPANWKVSTDFHDVPKMMKENIGLKMMLPMIINEITDGVEDDGWKGGLKAGGPAIFGWSEQTYSPYLKKAETQLEDAKKSGNQADINAAQKDVEKAKEEAAKKKADAKAANRMTLRPPTQRR